MHIPIIEVKGFEAWLNRNNSQTSWKENYKVFMVTLTKILTGIWKYIYVQPARMGNGIEI
jgi:hypothetical protein